MSDSPVPAESPVASPPTTAVAGSGEVPATPAPSPASAAPSPTATAAMEEGVEQPAGVMLERSPSAGAGDAAPASPPPASLPQPDAAAAASPPVAAAAAADPAASASPPTPAARNVVVASPPVSSPVPNPLLSTLKPLITSACHVVPGREGTDEDGNVFVHVIDGGGAFSCTPVDLTYLVLHAQKSRDSSYSVVGIMGCQSTGKSTLLNLLFGTRFQEMDSSQGRSQTTKGVWMDSGSRRRDLVIMDLEGTDSGERGEDRTTFERQTSLYALAVAEVLLINMWEHDIGRYTASNYGILRTVFEVNLALFDSQAKTVLLFVIRDHIEEETPLAQLQAKLHREIDKIWSEIRKPERFAQAAVKDLFELRFVALPHMKLQKALFAERVDALRAQFVNSQDSNYIFSSDFHGRKAVPADGFGVYMETIWSTIRENKELNLPTQKEMLATFRCEEVIHQLYGDQFLPGLADLKEAAAKTLVSDQFARVVDPLVRSVLSAYADETKHYHAGIVASKARELRRKMAREMEEIFTAQARTFVSKRTVDVCRAEMKTQMEAGAAAAAASSSAASATPKSGKRSVAQAASSNDAPHPAFAAASARAIEAAMAFAHAELAKFELPVLSTEVGGAADAPAVADADAPSSSPDPLLSWSSLTDKVGAEMRAAVDAYVSVERSAQLKKLSFHLDKVFKSQLSAPLTAVLKKANPLSMWGEIGKLYRKVRTNVLQNYVIDSVVQNYECTEEERDALVSQSELQLSQLIRLIVDQHVSMISLHLRSKFDSLFRYDAEGRIRQWSARDNIRALFKHARDETLKLLDLFAIFRLDEFKEADSEANRALEAEEVRAKTQARLSAQGGSLTKLLNKTASMSELHRAKPAAAASASAADGEDSDEDDDEERDPDEEKVGHSNIDYASVDAANIILDASARMEKESTFRFDIEGALREAELQQAANDEKTRVPLWMIGLVCFLGMDEILAVLRNPFLLVFLILVGGGAFMAHQVGALWPMIAVAKTTALHLMAQAQGYLNNALAVQPGAPSVTRQPSSRRTQSQVPPLHTRNPSLSSSYTEVPGSDNEETEEAAAATTRQRRSRRAQDSLEMTELHTGAISARDVQLELPSSSSNNSNQSSTASAGSPSASASGSRRGSASAPKKRGSVKGL